MELIYSHPWWTTLWLIIICGTIRNLIAGYRTKDDHWDEEI